MYDVLIIMTLLGLYVMYNYNILLYNYLLLSFFNIHAFKFSFVTAGYQEYRAYT